MASNFSSLSLGQLRTELRKRNAKLSGRKKELIERLEAYDRNQNFHRCDDLMPEFRMSLPPVTSYKDVNADMKIVPLSFESASSYLDEFGVSFDQKITELYNDGFLLYLRSCETDKLHFLRSACKAEMKKKISYIVDISLQKNGRVFETQCECGAGEGPFGHCKHVRALLYAYCKYVNCGELKLEMSCTEKLQQFHRCKKHMGSPFKARNLKLAGADEVCDIKDFDPRPEVFRNNASYRDYFRNLCLNFKGISKTPIFQIFEPANMRAFANDHDYLEMTQEEIFLKVSKISAVSSEDRKNIETYTRGQRNNERWVEEREKRIQSSNFHRICTATQRTNMASLADSLVSGQKQKENEAMRHGTKYEKEGLAKYEKDFNCKVQSCGIFVSKTQPFLGASPDGVINSEIICEVKCPFSAKNKNITPVTVPYLKLEDDSLTLSTKHQYYYQIQGQLFCAERKYCDLIIYTLSDIKYIRIERDTKFISSMIEKLCLFYKSHFKEAVLKRYFYKEM